MIECVGHPAAVNEGIELCRDGGKYLVLGQYADAGNISFNPHTITRKQLQLIGSWGFEPRHVDRALSLLAATNLKDAVRLGDYAPLPAVRSKYGARDRPRMAFR